MTSRILVRRLAVEQLVPVSSKSERYSESFEPLHKHAMSHPFARSIAPPRTALPCIQHIHQYTQHELATWLQHWQVQIISPISILVCSVQSVSSHVCLSPSPSLYTYIYIYIYIKPSMRTSREARKRRRARQRERGSAQRRPARRKEQRSVFCSRSRPNVRLWQSGFYGNIRSPEVCGVAVPTPGERVPVPRRGGRAVEGEAVFPQHAP